eukprot:gene7281-6348_t
MEESCSVVHRWDQPTVCLCVVVPLPGCPTGHIKAARAQSRLPVLQVTRLYCLWHRFAEAGCRDNCMVESDSDDDGAMERTRRLCGGAHCQLSDAVGTAAARWSPHFPPPAPSGHPLLLPFASAPVGDGAADAKDAHLNALSRIAREGWGVDPPTAFVIFYRWYDAVWAPRLNAMRGARSERIDLLPLSEVRRTAE